MTYPGQLCKTFILKSNTFENEHDPSRDHCDALFYMFKGSNQLQYIKSESVI